MNIKTYIRKEKAKAWGFLFLEDIMQREKRYIVLKMRDVDAALTEEQREQLDLLCDVVDIHRHERGADDLKCVVVEQDWPEYETVWQMIERGWTGII
jgi:hypothetical protein